MMIRRVLMLVSLGALAACGSASDATTFQAPPGYQQRGSIGPFVQVWRTADKKNMLVLTAIPAKLDLDKASSKSVVSDADTLASKMITICTNQPAYYADMIGTVNSAKDAGTQRNERIEFLATTFGGKTYLAVYVRPNGAPADPAADAALKNICSK